MKKLFKIDPLILYQSLMFKFVIFYILNHIIHISYELLLYELFLLSNLKFQNFIDWHYQLE